MFLWTRQWTSTTIMALLANDVPMITWKDIGVELFRGLMLGFPVAILWGQATIRMAAQINVPTALRKYKIPAPWWTSLVMLTAADAVVALLLYSVSNALPDTGTHVSFAPGMIFGSNGPAMIFLLRFVLVTFGIKLGEQFFPLALTGGIACGKSTVSKVLQGDPVPDEISPAQIRQYQEAREACYMIDTDKIGHDILLPPWHDKLKDPDSPVGPTDSVYDDILAAFGGSGHDKKDDDKTSNHPILDKDDLIDRTKLGALVFGNEEQRQKLNQITHRRIFKTLLKRMLIATYFYDEPWVVAEIPLLFESGPLRYLFGLTLCVACSPQQQLERLQARNPELTKKQCQERIDSQMPITTKVRMADMVIFNESGSVKNGVDEDALKEEVERVREKFSHRIHGVLGASLSQLVLLLTAALMISTWAKAFGYV